MPAVVPSLRYHAQISHPCPLHLKRCPVPMQYPFTPLAHPSSASGNDLPISALLSTILWFSHLHVLLVHHAYSRNMFESHGTSYAVTNKDVSCLLQFRPSERLEETHDAKRTSTQRASSFFTRTIRAVPSRAITPHRKSPISPAATGCAS